MLAEKPSRLPAAQLVVQGMEARLAARQSVDPAVQPELGAGDIGDGQFVQREQSVQPGGVDRHLLGRQAARHQLADMAFHIGIYPVEPVDRRRRPGRGPGWRRYRRWDPIGRRALAARPIGVGIQRIDGKRSPQRQTLPRPHRGGDVDARAVQTQLGAIEAHFAGFDRDLAGQPRRVKAIEWNRRHVDLQPVEQTPHVIARRFERTVERGRGAVGGKNAEDIEFAVAGKRKTGLVDGDFAVGERGIEYRPAQGAAAGN